MLLQLYTVSQKEDTKLMALTRQILTDFTSSFTCRFNRKSAVKWLLKISPGATLTCKMCSRNSHAQEMSVKHTATQDLNYYSRFSCLEQWFSGGVNII